MDISRLTPNETTKLAMLEIEAGKFARKVLVQLSGKPVREETVQSVAKKIAKSMAKTLGSKS